MTSDVVFGVLKDVPLRNAWAHEAHRFTPWLAKNIDKLADAVGIPLDLTGTEMKVGSFSADILARNPTDDSVVLIENQLEGSDHTHLGQIMTYLAGLETHTMIWVAPSFRDEHLSALRWLNEHTEDPFAFFAVKVRVVQIADSPYAPLFEVIERPNNWDRQVAQQKRSTEGDRTALGQHRFEFWTHFCSRYPEFGEPGAASSRWADLPEISAVVVLYISRSGVGVFVRGNRGTSLEELRDELTATLAQLAHTLGAKAIGEGSLLPQHFDIDTSDKKNWDAMSDWLAERTKAYQSAFGQGLSVPTNPQS